MKRLHVNVAVTDLESAVGFYSTLFASQPSVRKDDYAKWRLEDPRVNFSISQRGAKPGVDHLGIEVESSEELQEIATRLASATEVLPQENATCCYARSDKAWAKDPSGVLWETFFTHGESTHYGKDTDFAEPSVAGAKAVPAGNCCP